MRLLISVLTSLLALAAGTPVYGDCGGDVTLTGAYGFIQHPEGNGFYGNLEDCLWTIHPATPGTSVNIRFLRFSTEATYDFVVLYQGLTVQPSTLVAAYTGNSLPLPIEIPGGTAVVRFLADDTITETGFILEYSSSTCPNDCSSNGNCWAGVCECQGGAFGVDCSQLACNSTYCPATRGSCVSNRCQCLPGVGYGLDCQQLFCSGLTTYTQTSGTMLDHYGGGEYPPNVDCGWLIDPPSAPGTTLIVSIEYNIEPRYGPFVYDGVWIYDGADNSSLLAVLTGFGSETFVMSTGKAFVMMTSEGVFQTDGFTLSWELSDCPQACINGLCVASTCQCNHGWTGPDCNQTECSFDCYSSLGAGTCVGTSCQCSTGYSGPDCGECIDSSVCNFTQCAPASYVTYVNATGSIESNTGGNYGPSRTCQWVLSPQIAWYQRLLLTFSRLSLAAGSTLSFSHPGSFLRSFAGGPSLPVLPIIVGALPASIYVQLNAGVQVDSGFRLSYELFDCPVAPGDASVCSNHGDCVGPNACQCQPGWAGLFCNETVCSSTSSGLCNGRGLCRMHSGGNRCDCDDGWYGVGCSALYCSGTQEIDNVNSGAIFDRNPVNAGSYYAAASFCQWDITALAPGPVSVWFVNLDTEEFYDFVYVTSPNSPALRASGDRQPMPFNTLTNNLSVVFTSDTFFQYSGFELHFASMSLCPSSCSGSGWCLNQQCHCFGGTSGPACNQYLAPTALASDRNNTLQISPLQWSYSQLSWPYATYVLRVNIQDLGGPYPSELIACFECNRYPNTTADCTNRALLTWDQATITIRNTLSTCSAGLWTLALFAPLNTSVRVGFEFAGDPLCPAVPGAHGDCICDDSDCFENGDCSQPTTICTAGQGYCTGGTCTCLPEYCGPSCLTVRGNMTDEECNPSSSTAPSGLSAGYIALIVICIVLVLGLVVFVVFAARRRAHYKYQIVMANKRRRYGHLDDEEQAEEEEGEGEDEEEEEKDEEDEDGSSEESS